MLARSWHFVNVKMSFEKSPLNSSFCAVTADWKLRWLHNIRLYFRALAMSGCYRCCQFKAYPFTPKSDEVQISLATSPEILHHTKWRTWLFFACSNKRWSCPVSILTTSLTFYVSLKRLRECNLHTCMCGSEWVDGEVFFMCFSGVPMCPMCNISPFHNRTWTACRFWQVNWMLQPDNTARTEQHVKWGFPFITEVHLVIMHWRCHFL